MGFVWKTSQGGKTSSHGSLLGVRVMNSRACGQRGGVETETDGVMANLDCQLDGPERRSAKFSKHRSPCVSADASRDGRVWDSI